MLRRCGLQLGGGLVLDWPVFALAQQELPVVGFLVPVTDEQAKVRLEAARKGLEDGGLREGEHYRFAVRYAGGRFERLPELAREFQLTNPAVFISGGSILPVTQLVPEPKLVITAVAVDLVKEGFVESYARPGGLITGNVPNALGGEAPIIEKRISLEGGRAVHAGPRDGRPSPLRPDWGPVRHRDPDGTGSRAETRLLGVGQDLRQGRGDRAGPRGARVRRCRRGLSLGRASDHEQSGPDRRAPSKLQKPSIGAYLEMTRSGVLMTYGVDLLDGFRRAGFYAARILKGTKPGDLPIEQPRKFVFALNMKIARQLGLSIPPAIEARVDDLVDD